MSSKLLIVLGSGPGIGVATATAFASRGFSVALLSRNGDRLKEDADRVREAGTSDVKVHTYAVDVGDHTALKDTLSRLEVEAGTPEVVLFNAARIAPSKIGEESPDAIIQDFKVMNIGLYVAASWALPLLASTGKSQSDSHPCFFVSGGQIWEHPDAGVFALSMQKAAQVNFAGSLAQEAGPKGIHVATVSIGGVVSDDDPIINAKNIAGKFWDLYEEEKSDWNSMVNVGNILDAK